MTKHLLLASLALTAVLAVVQPAEAAPSDSGPCQYLEGAEADAAPASIGEPDAADFSASVLDRESLEGISGEGANPPIAIITDQTLTAITSGNSITAGTVGSGAITLDQNAFSGFDGIGNFVINSGHNNTLQSSLNVSIVLAP
jgi:hypothetical protein